MPKYMGLDDVQPIKRTKFGNKQTVFDGQKYKSKLEATFAYVLTIWKASKIVEDWQYEPQSLQFEHYDVRKKRHDIEYIPDFYVKYTNGEEWYYEVKGMVQQYDLTKWELFKKNRSEKFCVVFAAKLRVGKKGGISTFKHSKMKRIVDRIWEEFNKEAKKYPEPRFESCG